jgi:hypothetical protein
MLLARFVFMMQGGLRPASFQKKGRAKARPAFF